MTPSMCKPLIWIRKTAPPKHLLMGKKLDRGITFFRNSRCMHRTGSVNDRNITRVFPCITMCTHSWSMWDPSFDQAKTSVKPLFLCLSASARHSQNALIKIPGMVFALQQLLPLRRHEYGKAKSLSVGSPWARTTLACSTYKSPLHNYLYMPGRLTFSAPGINEVVVASMRGQSNITVFVRSAVQAEPQAPVLLWAGEEGMGSGKGLVPKQRDWNPSASHRSITSTVTKPEGLKPVIGSAAPTVHSWLILLRSL